jgi:RNA polymerase sigma-70 factor (ECF subfamily)
LTVSTTETPSKQVPIVDPDARLMLQVQGGDQSAFEELVSRYQNRVLGVLFNAIGNKEEAEDLAQEVFLRIFRARHGYKPTAKFSTWIFTITNNLAMNARRSRRTRRAVNIDADENGPLGARPQEQLLKEPGPSASGQLHASEVAELVRQAVGKLDERQRMAVLLSKFEDLGYAEIAEIMGTSTMAVKSLLARARTNLREMLEPYLDVI